MNIRAYLKKSGKTHAEFAKSLGVTRDAVSRWLAKDRYPRRTMVKKIERITNGDVTLQDIYS
jgi:transcriptional regulator with XRE-family HTH domain